MNAPESGGNRYFSAQRCCKESEWWEEGAAPLAGVDGTRSVQKTSSVGSVGKKILKTVKFEFSFQ